MAWEVSHACAEIVRTGRKENSQSRRCRLVIDGSDGANESNHVKVGGE